MGYMSSVETKCMQRDCEWPSRLCTAQLGALFTIQYCVAGCPVYKTP